MKNVRKWILAAALLSGLLILGGCRKTEPVRLDTSLKIDSPFEGERVMTGIVPESVIRRLFDGDIDRFKSLLEKYCPQEMACTVVSEGKDVHMTVSVSFATFDEYKTKIKRILTSDKNPDKDTVNSSVYYEFADTIFKKGFVIRESFSSEDMFWWITSAIREEFPRLEDEDLSVLFTSASTELVYDGKAIETKDHISYSDMVSNAFRSIHVSAEINEAQQVYSGRVVLTALRADYTDEQLLSLNRAMDAISSSHISLQTSLTNDEKTFAFSFVGNSTQDFASNMNRIFSSTDSKLEVSDESDKQEAFKAKKYITFYVNSGQYIDFTDPDSEATYTIQIDGNYVMDSCEGADGFVKSSVFESANGLSTADIRMSANDEVTLALGTDVAIERIDVLTRVNHERSLERQIGFYLSRESDALVGEGLKSRIEDRLNDSMTFEKRDSEEMAEYLVTITADGPENLAGLTCALLDGSASSGASAMSGGLLDEKRLRDIRMSYSDKIDFSSFLGASSVSMGIQYVFEYPEHYVGTFSSDNAYENMRQERNRLSLTTYNKSLFVSSEARETNWNGIIQLILWCLALAVMLVIAILSLPTVIRCFRTKNINWADTDLFTHKGYVIVTIFTVAAVVFVITSVRLIFKVY